MPDAPSAKPRLEKLGVTPGQRVSVLGVRDDGFVSELRARGADVSLRRRPRTDQVFLGANDLAGVRAIAPLERYLDRGGAVWVVYPKGRREIPEAEVIRSGVAQGFVDNKVVRFSDTHTALRFVIPKNRR